MRIIARMGTGITTSTIPRPISMSRTLVFAFISANLKNEWDVGYDFTHVTIVVEMPDLGQGFSHCSVSRPASRVEP
jgi:hypothetical protein